MSRKVGTQVGIVRVKRQGTYRLELTFDDGHVSVVDFGPFLRESLNPETRLFLDLQRFGSFSVVHGNLVWGDYAMCFPVEDLYEGRIFPAGCVSKTMAVAEERAVYTAGSRAARGKG